MELAADNERVLQEKMQMKNELDKMNENLVRSKVQDHNMMEHFNHRFMMENKMRDLEVENKNLMNEKQKFEVDYKILLERHNELKKHSENTDNEFNFFKQKQTEVKKKIKIHYRKLTI